jgi:WD40 repeat protein
MSVLCLWNTRTNEKQFLLDDIKSCMAAAFSPFGKSLAVSCGAGSHECEILLLDTVTAKVQGKFVGNTELVHNLQYSSDGTTLFSWGRFDTLRLWDVATRHERTNLAASDPRVRQMGVWDDGRILVTLRADLENGETTTITMHDTTPEVAPVEIVKSSRSTVSLAVEPDRRNLALGHRNGQILLRWLIPEPVYSIAAHGKEAWAVAFTPDSRTLASASDDHTVKLWNVATRKELATLNGHDSMASCVAYSKDGRLLATGSFDQKVKLWDTGTHAVLATLAGHDDRVRAVAFSRDGRVVASSGHSTLRLWDAQSGSEQAVLCKQQERIHGIAFSPTQDTLASVSNDRSLILWDVHKRRPFAQARAADQLWTIAYAPDGALLATGGADGIPRFWDKELHTSRAVAGTHLAGVRSVAFSPDGQTLASGGRDRTVCLWHVASGQKLLSFSDLSHEVTSVAFSPDGRYLAAALFDGSVLLWPAKS